CQESGQTGCGGVAAARAALASAQAQVASTRAQMNADGAQSLNDGTQVNQNIALVNYCINSGGAGGSADVPPSTPPGVNQPGAGAGPVSISGAASGSAQFQPFTADGYPVFSEAQIASIDAQYAQVNKEIATYGMTPSFTDAEVRQILTNYDHVQQLREAEKSVYPAGGAAGAPACMGLSDVGYTDIMANPDPADADVELGKWGDPASGTKWIVEPNESAYRLSAESSGVALDRFVARSPNSNVGENQITNQAQEHAYWAAHGIVDKHLFDSNGDWLGPSNGLCPSGKSGSGSAASAASAGALPNAHSVDLTSGTGLPDSGGPIGGTSGHASPSASATGSFGNRLPVTQPHEHR
ncbi:MAG: hypothetical protein ACYCPQ_11195, partial [Elusimicrobiota bacterium]